MIEAGYWSQGPRIPGSDAEACATTDRLEVNYGTE